MESCGDGSMRETYVPAGTPGKRVVSSSQVPPSLREIHARPSSVPAKRMPARIGDSFSDTIVQCVSAPVASLVMPPVVRMETRIFIVSAVDRSGEMANISSPRFVDFITRLAPKYIVCGLCGEMKYGVFQFQRRSSAAESARCLARSALIRCCCAGVGLAVVSARSMRTLSSYWSYRGRYGGLTRKLFWPDA